MATDPRELARLTFEVVGLVQEERMAEAVARGEEALRKIREALGPEHPLVADVLNAMGAAYVELNDGPAADRSFRQALEIRRNAFGENHPGVADVLSGIGHLYRKAKRYDGAEIMHRTALDIRRDVLGERDRAVADSLFNLGTTLFESGDLVAPEALFTEALGILADTDGDRTPSYASCLSNLASLYGTTGDWATAEPLDKQALAIRREALGNLHDDVAASLNNLGGLYNRMGDFEAAEPLFREALDIRRATRQPTDPQLAESLSNLGQLSFNMGDFAAAEVLHREALEIRREAYGPRDTWVGISLECLGALLRDMGDHAAAERHLRQAREIFAERVGDTHPLFMQCLTDLAFLCARTDRAEEALSLLRQVADIHDRYLSQVVAAGTERRRLGLLNRLETSLVSYLSFVISDYMEDQDTVGSALDLVLRRKGIAAEILSAERDAILGGRNPELAPQLEELTRLRGDIAHNALAGAGPEGAAAHQQLLDELRARRDILEQQLSGAIPELGLEEHLREADRRAVASALPPGSALVEFVKLAFIDFRAIRDWRRRARYVAFVLGAGEPEQPALVDLGNADRLDGLIASFRAAITGQEESRGAGEGPRSEAAPSGVEEEGPQLREAVFDPLLPHLKGRTRLFLSPDGDLTRLPFEVLPENDGSRLIERYVISYVSTGRDVLRFRAQSLGEASPSLVAAYPDFDLGRAVPSADEAPGSRGRVSRDFAGGIDPFDPLEGTWEEGAAVASLLGVEPWLEGSVLESRLKARRSPRILHLATHGFFLPDKRPDPNRDAASTWTPDEEVGPLRGPGMENPLLRSGLALAGANTFLNRRSLPEEAEDGIITAEDVSGLDLLGTELVVLSACETGLGEVRTGEGVFGLRRAFVLAGARTLVTSLWKVPDQATRDLMGAFYTLLQQGVPRSEALREAQLALARGDAELGITAARPEPWYWGAFICQGDPGPLPAG